MGYHYEHLTSPFCAFPGNMFYWIFGMGGIIYLSEIKTEEKTLCKDVCCQYTIIINNQSFFYFFHSIGLIV